MKSVKVFSKKIIGFGCYVKSNKIVSVGLLLIVIITNIVGCSGTKEKSIDSRDVISDTKQMSEDFNFSLKYGFKGNSEINTYNKSLTKDLIDDGTKSIEYEMPIKELQDIYNKLVELDIASITEKLISNNVAITPLKEYVLTFTMDGKEYTVSGDETMYSLDDNEKVNNFSEIIEVITEYIESSDEYKSLPEAKGYYE